MFITSDLMIPSKNLSEEKTLKEKFISFHH